MDNLKKRMIEALDATLGRVTPAAAKIDIARSTHYAWMKEDPEYKAAVDALGEKALDHVEDKLFELIDGAKYEVMTETGVIELKDKPSATAAIFYLKTKGKKRGYIERNELTGADGAGITITVSDSI